MPNLESERKCQPSCTGVEKMVKRLKINKNRVRVRGEGEREGEREKVTKDLKLK